MVNRIQQYQKDHLTWPSWLHPRNAGMVQHTQILNVIQYITRSKNKNYLIISIDTEKVFDET
jgi:hypothetical protein